MGSSPRKPAAPPPPPPPAPAPVEADQAVEDAVETDRKKRKQAAGRASTILTGGSLGNANVDRKTLLGS